MSFLSAMLPTIAGAGLMAASGGAINPMTAGLILGGLQTARTGSLQKGLMAGLGAYGGAGLAGGLAAAGTAQASGAIGESAALAGEEAAKQAGSEYAAKQAALNAAGQGATTPQALEALSQQQASLNAIPQSAWEQSAKDFAANSYTPTTAQTTALNTPIQTGLSGLGNEAGRSAFMSSMGGGSGLMKAGLAAAAPMTAMTPQQPQTQAGDSTMPQRLKYNQGVATPLPAPDVPEYGNLGQDFGRQRNYFPTAGYQQITPEEARSIRGYAGGGPVEAMSNANALGENTGYPTADIQGHAYATPWQTPVSQNVVAGAADTGVNRMTGQMLAKGGLSAAASHLGDYSDGGRLLKGPGDGVSDSIPATIGNKRPARLADGEFVVPARIVSELGNGSTDAGARKLYAMLDRVQKARGKTVGKGKVAKNSRADKYLPA